jgi:hypothetical protein
MKKKKLIFRARGKHRKMFSAENIFRKNDFPENIFRRKPFYVEVNGTLIEEMANIFISSPDNMFHYILMQIDRFYLFIYLFPLSKYS